METKKTPIAPSIAEQKKIMYYPTTVEEAQTLIRQEITALCEMRVHVMVILNTLPSKELDFMKDEVCENWEQFRTCLKESMDYLVTVACCLEELRVSKHIDPEPFRKEASHEQG